MAEVIKVSTIERHLFGPDAVPWSLLKLPSNLQKLQDRYKFSEIRHGADSLGNLVQLLCVGGEFVMEEVPQPLEQLILEPNAVQFQIGVTSDDSKAFLDHIAEFMTVIDVDKSFAQAAERTKTYQTIVTARLAVPFDALLSSPLQRFLKGDVSAKVGLPDAEAEIVLERLQWRISYKTQSTDFVYLPKALTIEPRAGGSPSEMLYYTQSPTDFKTHMSLLRAFENAFGELKERPKRRPTPKSH
jgi:hypothetical protein